MENLNTKSGRELKRQAVICAEPDHRKRSRTYEEEAKQKTRLLRLEKTAQRVHLSGVLIKSICYYYKGKVRHFPLSDMLESFLSSLPTLPFSKLPLIGQF
jgi:hypothetical protein